MRIGEAVASGASQGPKGAQEVEFKAVCSMADCERLNVIAGEWRAAVNLDRPHVTRADFPLCSVCDRQLLSSSADDADCVDRADRTPCNAGTSAAQNTSSANSRV
jgi:hypothetical protein